MRTCPYCGNEALTVSRKAALGPIRSARCKSCGKRISVHPASVLAVIPFVAGIGAAWYLRSAAGVAAIAVGAVAMFLLHEYFVPLVRRDG